MPLLSTKVCSLLTQEVVTKLRENGIKTVTDMLSVSAGQVSKQTGIPYQEIEAIRSSLLSQFGVFPVSCRDLFLEMKHISKPLPTGCTSLNDLLNGGLVPGQLTEVCGVPGAGKTQVCLCVTGEVITTAAASVAYVDSGGGFSVGRLREMLKRKHLEEKEVKAFMERVRVYHVFSIFELLSLVSTLKDNVAKQVDSFHSNLHLLVVDPVTLFISPLLGGHQVQGHALMNDVAMAMRVLAHEQSIAILYTNNVVVDREHSQGDGFKPALGLTWSHVPSTRIMLSHAPPSPGLDGDNRRIATLTKSTRQPVGKSVSFAITDNGLESS